MFFKVDEYAALLLVNVPCSTFFEGPISPGQTSVVFTCNPPLQGRYLSIQKTVFGVLKLDHVDIEPKISWSFNFSF